MVLGVKIIRTDWPSASPPTIILLITDSRHIARSHSIRQEIPNCHYLPSRDHPRCPNSRPQTHWLPKIRQIFCTIPSAINTVNMRTENASAWDHRLAPSRLGWSKRVHPARPICLSTEGRGQEVVMSRFEKGCAK